MSPIYICLRIVTKKRVDIHKNSGRKASTDPHQCLLKEHRKAPFLGPETTLSLFSLPVYTVKYR